MTTVMTKPNQIKFFATDWQPNGTNSLLVVNDEYEVIDSLNEALFGVNVANSTLAVFDNIIFSTEDKETLKQFNGEIDTLLKEVSVEDIFKFRACSPIDPNGKNVIKFVQQYLK
jgi:hypothetical protein